MTDNIMVCPNCGFVYSNDDTLIVWDNEDKECNACPNCNWIDYSKGWR